MPDDLQGFLFWKKSSQPAYSCVISRNIFYESRFLLKGWRVSWCVSAYQCYYSSSRDLLKISNIPSISAASSSPTLCTGNTNYTDILSLPLLCPQIGKTAEPQIVFHFLHCSTETPFCHYARALRLLTYFVSLLLVLFDIYCLMFNVRNPSSCTLPVFFITLFFAFPLLLFYFLGKGRRFRLHYSFSGPDRNLKLCIWFLIKNRST